MLITNSKDLNYFCNKLSENKFVAIDTEFMRDKTYYPILSLVQISSKNTTIIIDTLKDLDFSPLIKLLTQTNLIKVFHSAQQDCESVLHKFNAIPFPIFDTQIAAFFLGFNTQVGYDKLVSHLLLKNISKNLQFSNWLKRPLSAEQLDYALKEVTYLADLYLLIKDKLNCDSKKLEWVDEECHNIFSLQNITKSDNSTNIGKYFHISTNINYLCIIENVLKLRRKKARKLNVSKNQIYSDNFIKKMLFYIVKNGYNDVSSFLNSVEDIKELNDMLMGEQQETKSIITNKLELYNKRKNIKKNTLYYQLQTLLHNISDDLKIGSSIIATSNDLLKYSNGLESSFCRGWRYEIFGKQAEVIRANSFKK